MEQKITQFGSVFECFVIMLNAEIGVFPPFYIIISRAKCMNSTKNVKDE